MGKYPGKKAGWGKDCGSRPGLHPETSGPNKHDGFKARGFSGDKGKRTGLHHVYPDQGFGGKVTDEHHARGWGGDDGKLCGLEPYPVGHGKVYDEGPKK